MTDRLTVATWNVAHRIQLKSIPSVLADVLIAIGADVLVLTEFVDGQAPDRTALKARLDAAGYAFRMTSSAPARHNQVFVASRLPFELGDLKPPTLTSHATSNFLHVRMIDSRIELIGIRVPSYRGGERRAYRKQLTAILCSAADRPLVVTGDLNEDPFKGTSSGAETVSFTGAEMYSVPRPAGDWSFINLDKVSNRSRIDHVLHTQAVRVHDACYRHEAAGSLLAGPRSAAPLSDHAALSFAVEKAR
jgi:endonuclease/exonuclease/phosphatase family metal-dependent hydrolase